jgi:hypothetical protein
MTTREFIRNLKLLKEARMGLVQVRLGQLLMQKIGLVCIIRANFDSVLTTSLSSTLKRILPGQRSDKINGLSMQQWATLLKLKMSGKAHGSGDYDDERGGRRNALAAFATLATTVLAGGGLFQYLQSAKGQENLESFFKWGKQLTKDQVGVTDLERSGTSLKDIIIETNQSIITLVNDTLKSGKTSAEILQEPDLKKDMENDEFIKAQTKFIAQIMAKDTLFKNNNKLHTDSEKNLKELMIKTYKTVSELLSTKTGPLNIKMTDEDFINHQKAFNSELEIKNTMRSKKTTPLTGEFFLNKYNAKELGNLFLYYGDNKIEDAKSSHLIDYYKRTWEDNMKAKLQNLQNKYQEENNRCIEKNNCLTKELIKTQTQNSIYEHIDKIQFGFTTDTNNLIDEFSNKIINNTQDERTRNLIYQLREYNQQNTQKIDSQIMELRKYFQKENVEDKGNNMDTGADT